MVLAHSTPVGVQRKSMVLRRPQAQISGLWATDNSGQIWLNGVYTEFNTSDWGFAALSPFLIQSGFKEGLNQLEFRVYNSGGSANPSGLLVAGLKGVDDGTLNMPAVPEPSTLILLGMGALAFVFIRRRK